MNCHPFFLEIEHLETINKEPETLSSQAASKTIGGLVIDPTLTYDYRETGNDPISKKDPWVSYPDYETGF